MYWWEERGQGCFLVAESGDLDSTARVYRQREASGVSFVCWISEQNYGQQKHTMRIEAGKGREFGREKEEREERKGQPRGKIEAA